MLGHAGAHAPHACGTWPPRHSFRAWPCPRMRHHHQQRWMRCHLLPAPRGECQPQWLVALSKQSLNGVGNKHALLCSSPREKKKKSKKTTKVVPSSPRGSHTKGLVSLRYWSVSLPKPSIRTLLCPASHSHNCHRPSSPHSLQQISFIMFVACHL